MDQSLRSERVLIGIFLVLIFAVPAWQTIVEVRRGEKPQALDVFQQKPTAANLRAYERDLEDASEVARGLRPWAQFAQYSWLKDGGEKVVLGRDGWLFYGPGVQYLTERSDARKGNSNVRQAIQAIVAFHQELAARNIRLLVMPVPNKESVYPERLTHRIAEHQPVLSEETRALMSALREAGVAVVDLSEIFAKAKTQSSGTGALYLVQDSHWSPAGLDLAAKAVGQRICGEGWIPTGRVEYEFRSVTEAREGDILRMLRVPALERRAVPETIRCDRVVRCDDHSRYRDDPASDVLVLGDSFLRIFETDEPGSAGFIAHLAKELKRPLASIINDGGASTLVRQELSRRPALLANKKVVIWEFVERDIRLGTEGWQILTGKAD
jgi:SGNH hydrolase-like domain, acetyltransferase AlgX